MLPPRCCCPLDSCVFSYLKVPITCLKRYQLDEDLALPRQGKPCLSIEAHRTSACRPSDDLLLTGLWGPSSNACRVWFAKVVCIAANSRCPAYFLLEKLKIQTKPEDDPARHQNVIVLAQQEIGQKPIVSLLDQCLDLIIS